MNDSAVCWTGVAVVILVLLGGFGCSGQSSADDGGSETVVSTVHVEGMTCGGCELGVEIKVGKLAGVESIDASYEKGEARAVHDPEKVTPDDITAAIEELGYSAELEGKPATGDDAGV